MTYTLKDFERDFKALLSLCESIGLDVEEFCNLAESILQNGWESNNDQ